MCVVKKFRRGADERIRLDEIFECPNEGSYLILLRWVAHVGMLSFARSPLRLFRRKASRTIVVA
jgi:hypothetical protein